MGNRLTSLPRIRNHLFRSLPPRVSCAIPLELHDTSSSFQPVSSSLPSVVLDSLQATLLSLSSNTTSHSSLSPTIDCIASPCPSCHHITITRYSVSGSKSSSSSRRTDDNTRWLLQHSEHMRRNASGHVQECNASSYLRFKGVSIIRFSDQQLRDSQTQRPAISRGTTHGEGIQEVFGWGIFEGGELYQKRGEKRPDQYRWFLRRRFPRFRNLPNGGGRPFRCEEEGGNFPRAVSECGDGWREKSR